MSEKIKKLLDEIKEIKEITKDFGLVKHIFSSDEAERNIAKLRQKIGSIELLAEMSLIKEVVHPKVEAIRTNPDSGRFARVRYASKEKPGTFLAIYLGEGVTGTSVSIEDDKIKCELESYNPCLFVLEKSEIVFGYQSWWNLLESPEDLKEITNIDLENVWYVKALKQLSQESV